MVLLVMVLSAYACASGPTSLSGPPLLGDWKAVDGPASVRFAADGTFNAVDNQGMPVSGRYRLMGADGIQFEIRHAGEETETIQARVIQAGERLTLTFPGENVTETYQRLP
jgi:hypothetical protein